MKYITFNQKYENQIVNLWNECCTCDPITITKFRQQALYDDNFNPELCFITLDEESVVGFILATKRIFPYLERGLEPDRGWINVLFVDKKYRRCGLASKMFSIAEDFANNKHYNEIYLHTHKTLDGAIEFWTKMGFIITLDEGNKLETVHMEKQIRGLEIPLSHSNFNYAVEF